MTPLSRGDALTGTDLIDPSHRYTLRADRGHRRPVARLADQTGGGNASTVGSGVPGSLVRCSQDRYVGADRESF